jgi:hypothetical protein
MTCSMETGPDSVRYIGRSRFLTTLILATLVGGIIIKMCIMFTESYGLAILTGDVVVSSLWGFSIVLSAVF